MRFSFITSVKSYFQIRLSSEVIGDVGLQYIFFLGGGAGGATTQNLAGKKPKGNEISTLKRELCFQSHGCTTIAKMQKPPKHLLVKKWMKGSRGISLGMLFSL